MTRRPSVRLPRACPSPEIWCAVEQVADRSDSQVNLRGVCYMITFSAKSEGTRKGNKVCSKFFGVFFGGGVEGKSGSLAKT